MWWTCSKTSSRAAGSAVDTSHSYVALVDVDDEDDDDDNDKDEDGDASLVKAISSDDCY